MDEVAWPRKVLVWASISITRQALPVERFQTGRGMASKEAFDEWFTELRKQQPVTSYALNAAMARVVIASTDADEIVQTIARGNDIPSLKVLMAVDGGEALLKRFPKEHREMLTYAVAHMLVDNSGNEGFAQQWVKHLEHDAEQAAKIYRKGAKRPFESIVSEQSRVGMAILSDALTLSRVEQHRECPLLGAMQQIGVAADRGCRERFCYEVAAFLRIVSPDHLPMVSRREMTRNFSLPLERAMLKMDDATPALPALGLAYDTNNADVRARIHASVKDALRFGSEIFLEPKGAFSSQWELLMQWKDEDLMDILWKGRYRDSDPTKGQRSASFLAALCKLSHDDALDVVCEMQGMGLDLNRLSEEVAGDRRYGRRLIDAAVQYPNPRLFGWLLAQGCDPEAKNYEESHDRYPPESAAEHLDGWCELVPEGHREQSKRIDFTEAETLLRVWRSRLNALLALDEIQAPAGARP